MGIANVFKRNNKTDRFMALLIEQSELTAQGLRQLEALLDKPVIDEQAVDHIHTIEGQADEVRRILIDELHNTFVTPLDREDIFNLSLFIDDILDYAYTTIDELRLMGIETDPVLQKMVRWNREAAEEIVLAIQRLSANPRVAAEHGQRAKKLENQVEKMYRRALAELFNQADDVSFLPTLFKRREILRHVSNMADRVNNAADVLGMIVMKMT